MTELEMKLSKQLKIQEEMFLSELTRVTNIYEKNLKIITQTSDGQNEKWSEIVETQSAILKNYETLQMPTEVKLSKEQIDGLEQFLESKLSKFSTEEFMEKLEQLHTVLTVQ